MEWQPIEMAPKDGTAVLLCWAVDSDGQPIDWTKDPQTSGVFVQVASWWGDSEGEWVVYCSLSDEPRLHFTPTHWMPLPAPPQEDRPTTRELSGTVPDIAHSRNCRCSECASHDRRRTANHDNH